MPLPRPPSSLLLLLAGLAGAPRATVDAFSASKAAGKFSSGSTASTGRTATATATMLRLLPRAAPSRTPAAAFAAPPSRLGVRASSAAATSSAPLRSSSSSSSSPDYDVIVIGGGHAGCEAASSSARTGARTALVTQRVDTIGELSCNPSVGGIGKGHLVREVDALGGLIGDVADLAGCHFRVLNRRKGPAVRGPRAQMDRDLYKANMRGAILGYENLDVVEASVEDLLLDEGEGIDALAPLGDGADLISGSDDEARRKKMADRASAAANVEHRRARIRGVVITEEANDDGADGGGKTTKTQREISARCVVVTTGTFLRGVLMIGHDRYSGGRHLRDSERVEPPSVGLAHTLSRFGFPLGRLKTGTPPRLDGRTIDWDACPVQPSEVPAVPFSHLRQFRAEQPPLVEAGTLVTCHKSTTNARTHDLVQKYAHLLPKYDGMDGKGNGPRYCPSIYKKVERFPDRAGHNSFLEPEGLNTHIVYPNGMSGPYPEEVQSQIMRTMVGLENVDIVRPGYDVEYDFVNPRSLTHALETKTIAGLYLAGQICGTTGYEEAAAQGVMAGANAGRAAGAAARGEPPAPPLVLGRDEAYIGVLIDDLVTRGTTEPYRMFTSRAEYRISLRADNADLRLTGRGAEYGLITDPERLAALEARETMIEDRIDRLGEFRMHVTEWSKRGGNDLMGGATALDPRRRGDVKSAEEVLGMPHVTLRDVEGIVRDVQEERGREREGDGADESEELATAAAKEDEAPWEPSPPSIYDTVEASVKYKSYVHRQNKDMESWRKAQGARIPPDFIYSRETLPTLSMEELEKLNLERPATFAEASRISGVTPQSLVYLYHRISNRHRRRRGSGDKSGAGAEREEASQASVPGETAAKEGAGL